MEDKSGAGGVLGFSFEEGVRVVTPVTAGVEVVRSMIAVVEAVAVALWKILGSANGGEGREGRKARV